MAPIDAHGPSINHNDTLVLDNPEYLKPSDHDFLLTEVTPEFLESVAFDYELEGIGEASFPGSFPVQGRIWGFNKRLMIKLACRLDRVENAPVHNIIFLVNTASPYTYLSQDAMQMLVGNDRQLPSFFYVSIHNDKVIKVYLSPKDSHFANVSILGNDFLSKNNVSPIINWNQYEFVLQ